MLIIPPEIDLVIYAGDSTNYKNLELNISEFQSFIRWFNSLEIKHKVLIAGNHDAWATKKKNLDYVKSLGITYLEHEYVEIEGKLIFGSPYTPHFNDWYFGEDRAKLHEYWHKLTTNIDILVTHGPPQGVLDLAYKLSGELEHCGDSALLKAVGRTEPRYHVFGHLHDNHNNLNKGRFKYSNLETEFMNVSCVTDNLFSVGCTSHGEIFYI
jgi:Icc-related predicted phosphoesterase